MFEPTPLKLTGQFDILKFGTDARETVVVARKKGGGKVQILAGQFAPLTKEDSFKSA